MRTARITHQRIFVAIVRHARESPPAAARRRPVHLARLHRPHDPAQRRSRATHPRGCAHGHDVEPDDLREGARRGRRATTTRSRGAPAALTAMELFELVETTDVRDACDIFTPRLRGDQGRGRLRVDRGLARRGERLARDRRRGAAALGDGRSPERDDQGAGHRRRARSPCARSSAPGSTSTSRCSSPSRRIARVIEAYLAGLEDRVDGGQADRPASRPSRRSSSAAWTPKSTSGSTRSRRRRRRRAAKIARRFAGKAAIANAQLAYKLFREQFSPRAMGSRSRRRARGCSVRSGRARAPRIPAYRDVMYVEQLIGPDTVNTMPPATIEAFRDHGEVEAHGGRGLRRPPSASIDDLGRGRHRHRRRDGQAARRRPRQLPEELRLAHRRTRRRIRGARPCRWPTRAEPIRSRRERAEAAAPARPRTTAP